MEQGGFNFGAKMMMDGMDGMDDIHGDIKRPIPCMRCCSIYALLNSLARSHEIVKL